jgi:hypothetical protein
MSFSHPSCLQLPPPGGIRLDTNTPVFCPWGSLAAGDHYFEWRNKVEPCAFVSVLFIITPALDLSEPIVWSEDSTLFKGTLYYIFYHSLPPKLPSDLIRWLDDEFNYEGFNPSFFLSSLQTILDFYYAPVTPSTSPLENDQ